MAEETEGAQKPAESVAVDLPQRGELKEAEQTEAEQEEKQCRYCLGGESEGASFVAPCRCRGGQRWVHLECLRRWQRSILVTQPTHPAFYHEDRRISHCGVCTHRFSCPLPSRHEMMMNFTGAELAALVQEQSLICSSESWSAALRARIHGGLDRRSISNLVHWCRGVYLIYYCGAKQLVLSIPDEDNRHAVLQSLDSSGHIEIQGRHYEMLSEGPLSDLPQLARSEASSHSQEVASARRGAAWVRAAVRGQAEQSTRSRASCLFAALAHIHLPVDVTLQRIGNDIQDASDDSIRAVNLSNRISSEDLPSAVQAGMRKVLRAARLSGSLPPSLDLEHYLGGPCATSQCHVFLPVGEPDGVLPPLPAGYKSLGGLNMAIGTDLVSALRALGQVRGWATAEVPVEGPPTKMRRLGVETVNAPDAVDSHSDGRVRGTDPEEAHADEIVDSGQEEDGSDMGSDFWGGNAGELAATPPPDDSSEEDAENAPPVFDSAEMVVGMAAEHILRGAAECEEQQNERLPEPENRTATMLRPLKVFWGEARWQRTQLLGELARGDWGLCQAQARDLVEPARSLWPQLIRDQRPVVAPRSEMTRAETTDAVERERLLDLHLQARRRAAQQE